MSSPMRRDRRAEILVEMQVHRIRDMSLGIAPPSVLRIRQVETAVDGDALAGVQAVIQLRGGQQNLRLAHRLAPAGR